jgi:hypothetical protein
VAGHRARVLCLAGEAEGAAGWSLSSQGSVCNCVSLAGFSSLSRFHGPHRGIEQVSSRPGFGHRQIPLLDLSVLIQ